MICNGGYLATLRYEFAKQTHPNPSLGALTPDPMFMYDQNEAARFRL